MKTKSYHFSSPKIEKNSSTLYSNFYCFYQPAVTRQADVISSAQFTLYSITALMELVQPRIGSRIVVAGALYLYRHVSAGRANHDESPGALE